MGVLTSAERKTVVNWLAQVLVVAASVAAEAHAALCKNADADVFTIVLPGGWTISPFTRQMSTRLYRQIARIET